MFVLLCTSFLQAQNFVEDFGSGADSHTLNKEASTIYMPSEMPTHCPPGKPQDGRYIITANSGLEFNNFYLDNYSEVVPCGNRIEGDLFFVGWHQNLKDHTGNNNGRFMLVNGDIYPGEVYRNTISGLITGENYNFSVWVANILNPVLGCMPASPVNLIFEIYDKEIKIAESHTGSIQAQSSLENIWKEYGFSFIASNNTITIVVRNNAPGGCGNDFAIDDISIQRLNEIGVFTGENSFCNTSEFKLSDIEFNFTKNEKEFKMVSNAQGKFRYSLEKGKYTVYPTIKNFEYFTVVPEEVTFELTDEQNIFNQNFCISPKGIREDLEVVFTPIDAARPGFDATYKIVYKNKGNQTISGQVALNFNDDLLDYVSSLPTFDKSETSQLTWNFKDFKPFETRTINIQFNVNSPMEIPAVNNGDVLKYVAQIITSVTDATPEDNIFELEQRVVGSYDPNDKTCLEGDVILPDMVGDYVHYKIRFENTGDYYAENVVIEDFIDTTKFDINSLVVLNASHEQKTRIENNKVVFYFQGIKLPATPSPDRHGYVLFKIKTLPTLQLNDTFSNQANIYFDYNWPIQTNTATTTIKEVKGLSNAEFDFSEQIKLYPIPAKEVLNIATESNITLNTIEIYNIMGQLVMAVANVKEVKSIPINQLSKGTYIIKVNSNIGSSSTCFIKE